MFTIEEEKFVLPVLKEERAEQLGYLEETRAVFNQIFSSEPAIQRTINAALNELELLEQEEREKGESAEILYHGIEHVLGMARSALKSLLYLDGKVERDLPLEKEEARELKLLQEELTKLEKILVVAAILHDAGYYEKDPEFKAMRVDHETRSEQFIDEKIQELGLTTEEARAVKAIIEGTRFKTPLVNIHEILNHESSVQIPAQYCNILGIAGGAVSEASPRVKAILIGASMLGALDVLGADRHYIRNVAFGLFREFVLDKVALVNYLNLGGEAVDKKTAEEEKNKIPLQPNPRVQVDKTDAFIRFVAIPRATSSGLISAKDQRWVREGCLLDRDTLEKTIRTQKAIESGDPEAISDVRKA